jgi:hypothetical protein
MSHRRWMSPTDSLLVITAEEDTFLTLHDIDQHDVFDGTGMTAEEVAAGLREEPHWRVAIGVPACSYGHAMRNARGECVMCDPAALLPHGDMNLEEIEFLRYHGISLLHVCMAHGLERAEYGPIMKARGLVAAIGVTRCKQGHAMRNRHGKCLICNPASLAYSKRYRANAWVYLAQSRSGRLFKVGTSADLDDRLEQLNVQGYGNRSDWQLLASVRCNEAGRVEHEVQKHLASYVVVAGYSIREEECRELFRCSKAVALAAFREVTGSA